MVGSRILCVFLGVCLFAVGGCGGGDPSVPSDQQAVAEEIKTLGGNYFIDKKAADQGIFSVDLSGTKADDAMVAKLETLPALRHLKLNAAPITNASVASFKKMKSLSTLDIANTKVSEEAMRSLATEKPNLEIAFNVPKESAPQDGSNNPPAP